MLRLFAKKPWVGTRRARAWRLALRALLLIALVPVVLQWVVAYLVGSDTRLIPPPLLSAKSLLVVTAHPDDECLFFAPSILGVLDRTRPRGGVGGLLVMSTGNNDGIGKTRRRELTGSCAALGIDKSRCVALDHPDLQDSPRVWWDTALIGRLVDQYVRDWDVDAILTFDEGGVSGHINHRAVSEAIRDYAASTVNAPAVYELHTTSLLRKYTVLLDLPLTALPYAWRIMEAIAFPSPSSPASLPIPQGDSSGGGNGGSGEMAGNGAGALVASTWRRYLRTRQAFANHESQFSWDRHFYLVLSRYVWFNDLVKAPTIEDAQAS